MGNFRKLLCLGLMVASAMFPETAAAAPRNGMGAYFGLIGATEGSSESRGLSLGMDAQFVRDENWSLNPYLMISGERDGASRFLADGLAGLQLRRWFDDWFAGGQFFVHDRILFENGSVKSSTYGPSLGFVGGFEYAGGWGVEMQADLFEPNVGVYRNAVRMHVTYRWY